MPDASKTLELVFQAKDMVSSELRKIQPALTRTERLGRSAFAGIQSSARLALRGITGITGGIVNLARRLVPLGAVGGLLGGVGFGALIKSSADLGDRLAKLSDRLGLTTEFLSEMEFVAERSGVRVESLGIGFQRATRRIEQFVRTGRGPAAEAFEILGGGLAEAARSGQNFEQLLPRLADAFANLGTEQQRVAAAFQLFDSEGASFTQFLQTGSEGVRQLREEAARLGVTISRDAADAAANFNDKLSNLTRAFRGLGFGIAREFFDDLARAFDSIALFVANNRDSIISFFRDLERIASTLIESLLRSFGDSNIRTALIEFFGFTFKAIFDAVGEIAGDAFASGFVRRSLNATTSIFTAIGDPFGVGSTFRAASSIGAFDPASRKPADIFREAAGAIEFYFQALRSAIAPTNELSATTENKLVPAVDKLAGSFKGLNFGAPGESPFTQFSKGFATAADEIRGQFEDLTRIGERFSGDLFRNLSDNFFSAAKREFESFRDFVVSIFTSIVDSVLRILSDQAASQIVGLFASLLGGGSKFGGIQDDFFNNPPPLLPTGGLGSGPVSVPSGTSGFGDAANSVSQSPEITVIIQATDARSFRDMLMQEGSTLASALTNALAGNQAASSGLRRVIA